MAVVVVAHGCDAVARPHSPHDSPCRPNRGRGGPPPVRVVDGGQEVSSGTAADRHWECQAGADLQVPGCLTIHVPVHPPAYRSCCDRVYSGRPLLSFVRVRSQRRESRFATAQPHRHLACPTCPLSRLRMCFIPPAPPPHPSLTGPAASLHPPSTPPPGGGLPLALESRQRQAHNAPRHAS